MHEEGIQRLRGAIEERKEFVNKINTLQKQVEAGEIDVSDFYKEVIAMKDGYDNGII